MGVALFKKWKPIRVFGSSERLEPGASLIVVDVQRRPRELVSSLNGCEEDEEEEKKKEKKKEKEKKENEEKERLEARIWTH